MRVRTMLLGGAAATVTGLGLALSFGGSPVSAADRIARPWRWRPTPPPPTSTGSPTAPPRRRPGPSATGG